MKNSLLLLAAATILSCGVAKAEALGYRTINNGKTELIMPELKENGRQNSRARENEQLFTITPIFIYDAEKGIQPTMGQTAVPEDGSTDYTYIAFGDEVIIPFEMPAGKYDFLFKFESPEGSLFVAKDGVEINEDTEIVINAEEAMINHIEFNPCLPDGSNPLDKNLQFINWITLIAHKTQKPISYIINDFVIDDFAEPDNEIDLPSIRKSSDIWINDTDRFIFGQTMCAIENGIPYYINMPAEGCKTQQVTNNRDHFHRYTINTPDNWQDIIGLEGPNKNIYFDYAVFAGERSFLQYKKIISNIEADPFLDQIYVCPSDNKNGFIIKPEINIISTLEPSLYGIIFPLLEFDESGFQFQTSRSSLNGQNGLPFYNFPEGDNGCRPGFNSYIALAENENPVMGSNTPMVLFSRPTERIDFEYIGRYGELRTLDFLNQKFSIRLNGEEVWNDYLDMNLFYRTEDFKPGIAFEKGVWEYEMESENLIVDGLRSKTHCLMHFENNEEFTWPTLTALQFRNNDDALTERFDRSEDGKMVFMGGEWSPRLPNFTWGYDCVAPAELKVEYAPYGSEDFQPMEYTMVPEKRYMPGYGDYYESSLSQITTPSETGWYGVRFTMTDSRGNSQTQTVTPAFRISEMTSVNGITGGDSLDVQTKGREIIAPAGAQIYDTAGKRIAEGALAPGVYIVRLGAKSAKVLVR